MPGISLDDAITHGRGAERPFNCTEHDDSNASASVNVDKGVWYCYACGASGGVDGAVVKPDAALKILRGEQHPRYLPESWLDAFDSAGPSPYWAQRVGEGTASHFRCGTDPMTGEPTYPVRLLDGRIVGTVRRSSGDGPKYMYPYGAPMSRCLFHAGTGNRAILLVEGAGDVMSMHRDGIPDGLVVAGVYGAGVHHPQATWIAEKGFRRVLLGFDMDRAGQMACDRTAELARGLGVLSTRIEWSAKDPGDMEPGEAMSVVMDSLGAWTS